MINIFYSKPTRKWTIKKTEFLAWKRNGHLPFWMSTKSFCRIYYSEEAWCSYWQRLFAKMLYWQRCFIGWHAKKIQIYSVKVYRMRQIFYYSTQPYKVKKNNHYFGLDCKNVHNNKGKTRKWGIEACFGSKKYNHSTNLKLPTKSFISCFLFKYCDPNFFCSLSNNLSAFNNKFKSTLSQNQPNISNKLTFGIKENIKFYRWFLFHEVFKIGNVLPSNVRKIHNYISNCHAVRSELCFKI